MNTTTIIAEAGVNHNGDLECAKDLVRAAAETNADYVKFQTFKSEASLTNGTPKADYQKITTGNEGSMLEMVKKLELPFDAFRELAELAETLNIGFLSTAFDRDSISLLVELDLPFFKIPSGELTNPLVILQIAQTGKPILLSTGMATLDEIQWALGVIAFGYLEQEATRASSILFEEAFNRKKGQALLQERVTLLHCTTEYPAPFEDINLRAMTTMQNSFNLPIGYSDHSSGITVPIAAVALGALVIEKHFTLDRTMEGPDHLASLDPGQMKAMVKAIRETEQVLGFAIKQPAPSELSNKDVARKSLVALQSIRKGEPMTEQNMGAKKPGTGISAARFYDYVGTLSPRDFDPDELIVFDQ